MLSQSILICLKFLSFTFGHPFSIGDPKETLSFEFKNTKWMRIKIASYFIMMVGQPVTILYLKLSHDLSTWQIISNWRNHGLVVTDMLGIFAMILVDGCFTFCYPFILKSSKTNLNKLLRRFSLINAALHIKDEDINRVGKTRLPFLLALAISTCCASFPLFFVGFYILPPDLPEVWKWISALTTPIMGILSVGSPFIITVQIIYGYFIALLTFQVEKFQKILLEISSQAGRVVQKLDIDFGRGQNGLPASIKQGLKISTDEIICHGFYIIETMKLLNQDHGAILFIEMYIASFNFVLSIYFVCNIYTLFLPFQFSFLVLCFILTNSFVLLFSLIRLLHLNMSGNGLENALEEAKDTLHFFRMSTFEQSDEKILLSLECLQEQLAAGSRLSPFRGFTFNLGNALSAFGLVTTWAIVLLQFRQPASPLQDALNNHSNT